MSLMDNSKESSFGEKSNFNVKLLLSQVWSNWYWFILSLLLCLGVAYTYLRYTTPTFNTTAKILLTGSKSTGSGQEAILAKAVGGQLSTTSGVLGEIEILKTRPLMEKVVRELKSYITYYHKGQVRAVDLYKFSPFNLNILGSVDSVRPISLEVKFKGNQVTLSNENFQKTVNIFQDFVIPGLGKVQVEKGIGDLDPAATYIVNVSTIPQAAGGFLGGLSVGIPTEGVDIISLGLVHSVPAISQDVLNKLVELYVKENITDKNKIADSTIAFIENRLVYVSQELGDVEGKVQSFRQRNKLANIDAQAGQLITSTAKNEEELARVETQISILNSIEEFLLDAETNQRIVPNGALLEDPSFSTLVERYNQIVLQKEKNALSQTNDNPYMQNLNTQIANARADMLTSLKGLRSSLNIAKDRTETRSSQISGKVNDVPGIERVFLDLSRQQQIKQELYVFLMQKREEMAISKTSNIANCKIIEPPLSSGPISPVSTNAYGYGFVLGLLIPFGFFFLKEQLNTRIRSRDQIVGLTQAPILGEIGNSDVQGETIVVTAGSRTPISEQFRALRTNLTFFLKENERTILLTSSMSGEGKSFVSLNLATVLAISGKKVVVMELDLRKPNLSNKLDLNNDMGFTNFIVSSSMQPEAVIKASGTHENLSLISSGNIPPNPAEIILNKRTKVLMDYLKDNYDYIIMDAPPIGMVTDAQLLSEYTDLTLYVVRQNYTFKDQLSITQELYENKKMKQLAVLVNDVSNDSSYGYGYGYGYGTYGNEPVKKGFLDRFKK